VIIALMDKADVNPRCVNLGIVTAENGGGNIRSSGGGHGTMLA
jgi:hypothetical protein